VYASKPLSLTKIDWHEVGASLVSRRPEMDEKNNQVVHVRIAALMNVLGETRASISQQTVRKTDVVSCVVKHKLMDLEPLSAQSSVDASSSVRR
jgi:hypothetical protein